MRLRYIGDDEGQIVPLSTGTVKVNRREWFDAEPEDARALAQRDDFELEGVVKAKRTRARNAEEAPESPPDPEPPTAASDEETHE